MKMTTTNKIEDDELTVPLVDDCHSDEENLQKPLKKTYSAAPPSKTGAGGLSCCCKCFLITFFILTALGAIFTVAVYSAAADVVEHLTVTNPHAPYPIVDMTDKEMQVVQDRVELFVDQVLAGNAKDNLVITEKEINGFVGHSDYLRGNLYVTLRDGGIIEEYSLPTEMLPGGKGRYFVGDDYMKVKGDRIEVKMQTEATHQDWFDGPLLFAQLQYLVGSENLLELYLTKGSFFGNDAPKDFIDQRQNLLEDFYNDPDAEEARIVMKGIEHVTIQAGRIVVVPRKH